jgi:hypothetical protein
VLEVFLIWIGGIHRRLQRWRQCCCRAMQSDTARDPNGLVEEVPQPHRRRQQAHRSEQLLLLQGILLLLLFLHGLRLLHHGCFVVVADLGGDGKLRGRLLE